MPVYLIHLHEPVAGVNHYVGYASDLHRRMEEHHRGCNGKTSKLMLTVTSLGISWEHVNTFATGDLKLDYQLEQELHKLPDSKIAQLYCPTCMKAKMLKGK